MSKCCEKESSIYRWEKFFNINISNALNARFSQSFKISINAYYTILNINKCIENSSYTNLFDYNLSDIELGIGFKTGLIEIYYKQDTNYTDQISDKLSHTSIGEILKNRISNISSYRLLVKQLLFIIIAVIDLRKM